MRVGKPFFQGRENLIRQGAHLGGAPSNRADVQSARSDDLESFTISWQSYLKEMKLLRSECTLVFQRGQTLSDGIFGQLGHAVDSRLVHDLLTV